MRENSLKLLIKEVEKDLKNQCFISALIVALTIPDICGNIAYPNSGTGERYRKWFDKYIGDYQNHTFSGEEENSLKLPYLDGKVCYALRNSFLHSGSDDIAKELKLYKFDLLYSESLALGSCVGEQEFEHRRDGKIVMKPPIIEWKIYVPCLCRYIIDAARIFMEDEITDESIVPTIQIYPEIPKAFLPKTVKY